MIKNIKLWWKQLWCKHDWHHKEAGQCADYELWVECNKCGLQEEVE